MDGNVRHTKYTRPVSFHLRQSYLSIHSGVENAPYLLPVYLQAIVNDTHHSPHFIILITNLCIYYHMFITHLSWNIFWYCKVGWTRLCQDGGYLKPRVSRTRYDLAMVYLVTTNKPAIFITVVLTLAKSSSPFPLTLPLLTDFHSIICRFFADNQYFAAEYTYYYYYCVF